MTNCLLLEVAAAGRADGDARGLHGRPGAVPIVTMIADYRNEFVWNVMKRNSYILSGLKKAGFKGGWLDAGAAAVSTPSASQPAQTGAARD